MAIELAASRVRVLAPEQIAPSLSEPFRLLAGTARMAVARQQTMESSLDWSHDVLTDAERQLFLRLGVFASSFDLEAAADVCGFGDIQAEQVLDLVTMLIDKKLVTVEELPTVARYRLLETMRMYARDRLSEAGEDRLTQDRR